MTSAYDTFQQWCPSPDLFELSEPESPHPRDRREEESDVGPETETDEDDREPRKRSKREGLARMTKSRVQQSDADVYDSITEIKALLLVVCSKVEKNEKSLRTLHTQQQSR